MNFSPDKDQAKALSKKRLTKFVVVIGIILVLIICAFSLVYGLGGNDQAKIFGLIIVSLQALSTITFFVIFDNGAANRLRKMNFKVEGITSKEQAHTYYYALKQSGFTRLIINFVILLFCIGLSLIPFLA